MLTKEQIEKELYEAQQHLIKLEQEVKEVEFIFISDYVGAHRYLQGKIDTYKEILEQVDSEEG